jgi:hypothetical protein
MYCRTASVLGQPAFTDAERIKSCKDNGNNSIPFGSRSILFTSGHLGFIVVLT